MTDKVVKSFRIEKEIAKGLKKVAKENGLTESEVVSIAIETYLYSDTKLLIDKIHLLRNVKQLNVALQKIRRDSAIQKG